MLERLSGPNSLGAKARVYFVSSRAFETEMGLPRTTDWGFCLYKTGAAWARGQIKIEEQTGTLALPPPVPSRAFVLRERIVCCEASILLIHHFPPWFPVHCGEEKHKCQQHSLFRQKHACLTIWSTAYGQATRCFVTTPQRRPITTLT